MYTKYFDIIRRIPEYPKWWLAGVPRYEEFDPRNAGVYAKEVALIRIHAQPDIDVLYDVAEVFPSAGHRDSLQDQIAANGEIEAHDPPQYPDHHGVSTSSTGIHVEILQFWVREDVLSWQRVPSLEGPVYDENERTVRQPYLFLASRIPNEGPGKTNPEWTKALKARDVAGLRDMLAGVGCPRPTDVALMALRKYLEDKLRWDELHPLYSTWAP